MRKFLQCIGGDFCSTSAMATSVMEQPSNTTGAVSADKKNVLNITCSQILFRHDADSSAIESTGLYLLECAKVEYSYVWRMGLFCRQQSIIFPAFKV